MFKQNAFRLISVFRKIEIENNDCIAFLKLIEEVYGISNKYIVLEHHSFINILFALQTLNMQEVNNF